MLMREYALEVKVRNNWLLQRMRLVGVETAAELSRLSGVSQNSIGDLLNLAVTGAHAVTGEWRPWVVRIANALRCLPEDIVPPQHVHSRLERNKTVREVGAGELQALLESRQGDPQLAIERKERDKLVAEALDSLSEIERDIIRRRWGIETGSPETLEEVAKACGRTRERVRQIEWKGMHKLQQPSRLGKYKDDLIGGGSRCR